MSELDYQLSREWVLALFFTFWWWFVCLTVALIGLPDLLVAVLFFAGVGWRCLRGIFIWWNHE